MDVSEDVGLYSNADDNGYFDNDSASALPIETNLSMSSANETSPSKFVQFLHEVATPVIYSLISLVGIVGNSLVIYVIISRRQMRTVTNLLLLNLAFADLCFVVIVPPFTAYQQATSTFPFGDAVCKLLNYLVNVTAYVTVYTLVLISVIRYMTVVHSVRTAPIRTRQNVSAMVAAIWVVVLVVNIPILMSYGVTEEYSCEENNYEVGQQVFTTFFAFAYVVPLAVIAVFSTAILRHITSHKAASMIHQQQNRKSRSATQKANVSRLLILVIVIFALFWLPVHVHLLLAFYCRSWIHDTPAYQALAVLWTSLAYFNSCVNPIIYNRTSKEFRDAFRQVMWCMSTSEIDKADAAAAATAVRRSLKYKQMEANAKDAGGGSDHDGATKGPGSSSDPTAATATTENCLTAAVASSSQSSVDVEAVNQTTVQSPRQNGSSDGNCDGGILPDDNETAGTEKRCGTDDDDVDSETVCQRHSATTQLDE